MSGKVIELTKRSQLERMLISESLLSSVWAEISAGTVDKEILQTAANAQVQINRIVWKLNSLETGADMRGEENETD